MRPNLKRSLVIGIGLICLTTFQAEAIVNIQSLGASARSTAQHGGFALCRTSTHSTWPLCAAMHSGAMPPWLA